MKYEKISSELLFKLVRYVALLIIIIYPIMGYYFSLSHDNVNMLKSQLCFSADKLRNEYNYILLLGGLDVYRIGQSMDFGFMFLYSLLIVLISIKWSRIIELKYKDDIKLSKMGYTLVYVGVLAGLCDMMENIFIFKMIGTEPSLIFPDSWAIIQSTFSLIKWICIFTALTWYFYIRIRYRKK